MTSADDLRPTGPQLDRLGRIWMFTERGAFQLLPRRGGAMWLASEGTRETVEAAAGPLVSVGDAIPAAAAVARFREALASHFEAPAAQPAENLGQEWHASELRALAQRVRDFPWEG